MSPIDPLWPLLGGLLIGLAAALYLLGLGRVAGISGIAAETLGLNNSEDRRPAVVFVVGLLAGAWLAARIVRQPEVLIDASPGMLVVAGLLVGFGTRWGGGCTSGHGICGLARGSRRSIIATCVFMGVAAGVVFAVRHLVGGGA